MTADNRPVVYCTTTNRIIEFVTTGESHDQAIARYSAEYGTSLVILPLDDAWQRHETAFKTEPVDITEARFHEMLNVLPPVRWVNDGTGESFKISERLTGCITAIFVRINDRHFSFDDDIRTPHAECCRRVFHSQAYRQAPENGSEQAPVSQPVSQERE